METVKLPPLASYPPPNVQAALPPAEWQACLDAWIFGVELRLRLASESFREVAGSIDAAGINFLESYITQATLSRDSARVASTSNGAVLRRLCLLLAKRVATEHALQKICFPNGSFRFFSGLCKAYHGSALLTGICEPTWRNNVFGIRDDVSEAKAAAVSCLTPGKKIPNNMEQADLLRRLTALTEYIPEVGAILMTGSDFLDSLDATYRCNQELGSTEMVVSKRLTAVLYRSLSALTVMDPPQSSLLMDQVFSLKALHDGYLQKHPKSRTLLSDLLCTTLFVVHLQSFLATSSQKRGNSLLESLRLIKAEQMPLFPRHPRPMARHRRKGKARATTDTFDEIHVHSLTLASQVQELFPDLQTEYILRLLLHFQDDVEAVTAALLEPESLPSSLQKPLAEDFTPKNGAESVPEVAAAPASIVGERRNVFDDDEFSNLRISSSQLNFGKKDQSRAQQLSTSERSAQKAAILSALAKFDSDSDERDDTYDVADVGGTVDSSLPGTDDAEARPVEKEQRDKIEEFLYRAWKSDTSLFARETKTRLSQPRTSLKRETGWTDEQIEGWAIILQRDKQKVSSLERKYGLGGSRDESMNQTQVKRTAWRASDAAEDEGSEADGDIPGPSNLSRGGGRGRGRGARVRAEGNAAGSADDYATQVARRRKEQGKGGRGGGNHNRRGGRARKMARGFGGLSL
ncbi:MAG: hypothetical protein Q9160_008943 [Pyrenula sp. 1 TL-2023]